MMDSLQKPQKCRYDERTRRCRRRKKNLPGSSPLLSIPLNIPSSGIEVPISRGVVWYSVVLTSPGTLQADTLQSALFLDTKIAIYNSDGLLLNVNDDVGGDLYSGRAYLSDVSSEGLDAGTYYIAVGFTGMIFGPTNFSVNPNNVQTYEGVSLSVTYTSNA